MYRNTPFPHSVFDVKMFMLKYFQTPGNLKVAKSVVNMCVYRYAKTLEKDLVLNCSTPESP